MIAGSGIDHRPTRFGFGCAASPGVDFTSVMQAARAAIDIGLNSRLMVAVIVMPGQGLKIG
jgi:hypothetical protein